MASMKRAFSARDFVIGGVVSTAIFSGGMYMRFAFDKATKSAAAEAPIRTVNLSDLETCPPSPQNITRHTVNAKSKDGVGFSMTLYAESEADIKNRDALVQQGVASVIGMYKAKELEAGGRIPNMGHNVGPNMKEVTVNVLPARGLKAAFEHEIATRAGKPLAIDIRGDIRVSAERNTFQKAVVADLPQPPRLAK